MLIEDTIHIENSKDIVWRVTVDVERWPEWTPTVSAAHRLDKGPFRLGSAVRIKQPGQPASDWIVTEYVHEERFTWESRRLGLRMAASHEVQGTPSGTSNTLRIEASGLVVAVLWPVFRLAIGRALTQENRGLKARCEAGSTSTPA